MVVPFTTANRWRLTVVKVLEFTLLTIVAAIITMLVFAVNIGAIVVA